MNILSKNKILIFLHFLYPLGKPFFTFEIFTYHIVGIVNTTFNILLFWLLYNYVFANTSISFYGTIVASHTICLLLAFAASIPTGYWLNKNFAFQANSSEASSKNRFWKYVLVVSQGLLLDFALFTFLIQALDVKPNLAKLISTVIIVTINYLLQKHFTFRKK